MSDLDEVLSNPGAQSLLAGLFARAHDGEGNLDLENPNCELVLLSELNQIFQDTAINRKNLLDLVKRMQESGLLATGEGLVHWSEKDQLFVGFNNKTHQRQLKYNDGYVQLAPGAIEWARSCFTAEDLNVSNKMGSAWKKPDPADYRPGY